LNLLYAIPAAVGLGALHFLEPGHGKGVMTAYLVSSRARTRDAVLLAFTSALSHTLVIFLLALVTTSALQFLLPQQIEAYLGLLSGAVITFIGGKMVFQKLFPPVVSLGRLRATDLGAVYVCAHGHVHHEHDPSGHDPHHHPHDHERIALDEIGYGHSHGHAHSDSHGSHSHSHVATRGGTPDMRRLLTIGVLAGLIPCPSALVMLLAATSAGQIPLGIGLVVAFSLGGALSLSLIGILLLKAEHKVRYLERRRFADMMGTLSALLIVIIGFLVAYESILKLGLF
jgi:nickel/cobalt transporter (NicO) family protein